MKSYISFLFILLFTFNFAKPIEEDLADNYLPVTIQFEDGSERRGFIKSFIKSKVIVNENSFNTKFDEKLFGLKTKTFSFKSDRNGKTEKLSIKDIKSMTLVRGEKDGKEVKMMLDKVVLSEIKKNKSVKKENEFTLLPVFYKSPKITVHFFKVDGGSTQFYFRKTNDNLAFKHSGKMNDIFNPSGFNQRIVDIFEYIGRDCPQYLAWLATIDTRVKLIGENKIDQAMKEQSPFHQLPEDYKEDIKEARKTKERKDFKSYKAWRKEQLSDDMIDSAFMIYEPYVTEYLTTCE